MVYLKYLLSALAVANLALADDCGGSDTIKIESQGDADKYSSCKTLKGDVEISSKATDSITLNDVQKIEGSLSCKDADHLTGLTAPSLSSIGDEFALQNLTRLSSLEMDKLSSVGSIKFTAVPNLQTLHFEKGVTEASSVKIINTALTNLDGIALETVGSLIITNNPYLKKVNVDQLTNATGLINFSGNMDSLEIDFPNLLSGSNMTFTNVSSVSAPALHNLTGQLGFWGNSFKEFSAPNLTTSTDLTFVGNDNLKNISMGALKKVDGGFKISRNDELEELDFPKLETVTGAVDFSGKFDTVKMGSLKDVKGGFNIQSTAEIDCDPFRKLRKQDKAIHGSFKCSGKKSHPTQKGGGSGTTGGGGSGTSSGGSSSSSSAGAAADNVVNMPAMGMAAVFGALVQYAL